MHPLLVETTTQMKFVLQTTNGWQGMEAKDNLNAPSLSSLKRTQHLSDIRARDREVEPIPQIE